MMTFLIAVVVSGIVYLLSLEYFEMCASKFGYDFMGAHAKGAGVFAVLCFIYAFVRLHYSPLAAQSPEVVLALSLGTLSVLGLWVFNVVRTNWSHGLFGSVLQLAGLLAFMVKVIGLLLGAIFMGASSGRSRKEEEKSAGSSIHQEIQDYNNHSGLSKNSPNYRFKNEKNSGY